MLARTTSVEESFRVRIASAVSTREAQRISLRMSALMPSIPGQLVKRRVHVGGLRLEGDIRRGFVERLGEGV